MAEPCEHLKHVEHTPSHVKPGSHGCAECLTIGDVWVHLRLCLTCGHVGCCDDSPNRHATKHFHAVAHPVIKSFEPGEDWAWCFVHEQMVDAIPAAPAQRPRAHIGPPGRK